MSLQLFQAISSGGAVAVLFAVLWMLAVGKLRTGAAYDEMRKDRDWYRQQYADGGEIREDRDYYRDRFAESTSILSTLLSTVEVEEEQ